MIPFLLVEESVRLQVKVKTSAKRAAFKTCETIIKNHFLGIVLKNIYKKKHLKHCVFLSFRGS